jgi:hypothetical protein
VILPASAWAKWLDPATDDVEALQSLLVPAPDSLLTMHKVSTDVNNVRNKGAELIAPLAETAAETGKAGEPDQLVLGQFEAGQLPFDQ